MREMVFRERQERVAHMEAIAKMVATVFNVTSDRAFGGVIADYAAEVFQETYDPEMLRRRAAMRRQVQAEIQTKRSRDEEMLRRLDRMSDLPDLMAKKKPSQNK